MNVPFVDLKAQYTSIKIEIDEAISRILSNTSFIGGEEVLTFESAFAKYQQSSHCISCANGTDAIEIGLEALGVGIGDEVIVPSYTWISTASAVTRVGATPVFVDVDPTYYTLDPTKITEKINSKTKAVIPVHFYGLPANMPEIISISKSHGLFVLEDCAQAHGAEIEGKKVGTFGDIATFSFYPGKNLGAYGDGGCIVTQSEKLAVKCRLIARLGQEGKHNHLENGRNSRLDTLQAAVLNVKLRHLNTWTKARRLHADSYRSLLRGLPIVLPKEPHGYKHVYHVFMIQSEIRDKLKSGLLDLGIQTQLHYRLPLTSLPMYSENGIYPVSDSMAKGILSLPMYPELSNSQIEYVVESIEKILGKVVT